MTCEEVNLRKENKLEALTIYKSPLLKSKPFLKRTAVIFLVIFHIFCDQLNDHIISVEIK